MADIATILARGDLKALAEVPADRLREYLLTEMENERKEAVPGGDRWISLGMKFGRAGRPDAERVLLDSLTNQPSKETLDLVSLFLLGFWFRRACPERPSPLTMDTFLRESERLTLDATSRAAVAYFLCEALQNGLDLVRDARKLLHQGL